MKNKVTTEFRMYGVQPEKLKRPDSAKAALSGTNRSGKSGPYSTGDGDEFHQLPRPGSDHSHIKSRGDGC